MQKADDGSLLKRSHSPKYHLLHWISSKNPASSSIPDRPCTALATLHSTAFMILPQSPPSVHRSSTLQPLDNYPQRTVNLVHSCRSVT